MKTSESASSSPLPAIDHALSGRRPQLEWLPAADGKLLACRVWRGQTHAPILIYLHGIEGHSQWFENTASELNKRGLTVYAPDRRGSGLNVHDRGHLPSYKVFLSDVESVVRQVTIEHPGQPIVLAANCWAASAGAVIAAERYKTDSGNALPPIKGLVLICPAIYTKIDLSLKTKLDIAWSIIRGGRAALKPWKIPIELPMFTDNQIFLDFLERDSLRLQEATSRFFFETFLLTRRARRIGKQLKLPTLVIQASNDQIVDIDAIKRWCSQSASKRGEFRLFPNAAHSIDFDRLCFPQYCQAIADWTFDCSNMVAP